MLRKLLKKNKLAKPLFKNLFIVNIFTIILASVSVLFVQYLIDVVIPSGNISALYVFLLFFLLYDGFRIGLTYFTGIIKGILFRYINVKLLLEMINTIIYGDIERIERYKKGELLQRMYESSSVNNYIVTFVVQLWSNFIAMISCGLIILIISWQAFVIVSISATLLYFIYRLSSGFTKKIEEERFSKRSIFITDTSFMIDNLRSVKSSGLRSTYYEKSSNQLLKFLKLENKLHYFRIRLNALVSSIELIALNSVRFTLVYSMFGDNRISLGELVTVLALSDRVFKFILQIFRSLIELQRQEVQVKRIYNLIENNPVPIKESNTEVMLHPDTLKSIELKSVSVTVGKNKEIYFGSKYIQKNDLVHVRGKIGSGKTTLCLLLAGLKTEHKGKILINGRLKDHKVDLNMLTAYTGPGDVIFEGSVAFNIFLNGPYRYDELVSIVNDIQLSELIESLPSGYETQIGGTSLLQLSEGQKQKIFFLRVYFSTKPILIFDEIFRGMDTESRVAIEIMISQIKDKIILLTTHQQMLSLQSNVIIDMDSINQKQESKDAVLAPS